MNEIKGLKEVMCQIIFVSDEKYDLTIPGLLYTKVKSDFPEKFENVIKNVKIENENTDNEIAKIDRKILTIFKSEDGTKAIQVGENILVNNSLGDSFNWDLFKKQIDLSIETYLSLGTSETSIGDLSLRFLIGCDVEDNCFSSFFKYNLPTPSQDSSYSVPSSFRCKFDYDKDDGKLIVIFRTLKRKSGKEYLLELNFDLQGKEGEFIDTREWLESAYANILGYYQEAINE